MHNLPKYNYVIVRKGKFMDLIAKKKNLELSPSHYIFDLHTQKFLDETQERVYCVCNYILPFGPDILCLNNISNACFTSLL